MTSLMMQLNISNKCLTLNRLELQQCISPNTPNLYFCLLSLVLPRDRPIKIDKSKTYIPNLTRPFFLKKSAPEKHYYQRVNFRVTFNV